MKKLEANIELLNGGENESSVSFKDRFLSAFVSVINQTLSIAIKAIGSVFVFTPTVINSNISPTVDLTNGICPEVIIPEVIVPEASITSSMLRPSLGFITHINGKPTIKWREKVLTWDEHENYAGATKYNLLTASGVWELEELL